MPWNPEVYNQFKVERYAPFYDLVKLVTVKPNLKVIDLGCGTGELTSKLAASLPASTVLGIDSSKEMLGKAEKFRSGNLAFECTSIEEAVHSQKKFQLVFSNAALQWVENHEKFFPKIFSLIAPGGQLAVQMPSNHDHPTHTTVQMLAQTEAFKSSLKNWIRIFPVLKIERYAEMLFQYGAKSIVVFEKVYPHILKNAEAMVDWTRGTLLVPYMEKLDEDVQQLFLNQYKEILQKQFPGSPVFYPFKRIFISAFF